MIKEYKSVVKAERFDGSEEMIERYGIRKPKSDDLFNRFYFLKIKSQIINRYYYCELQIGQYIVTLANGELAIVWKDVFKELFPEAEND